MPLNGLSPAAKYQRHPGKPAVALVLPSDCPLRWAQYLRTLQPVLHVGRARLLPLLVGANLAFPQGPSARRAQLE
jgi:hypothetical protein